MLMQNLSELTNKYRFQSIFNIIYKSYLKYQFSNEKISELSICFLDLYKKINSIKTKSKNEIKISKKEFKIEIESKHSSFSDFCGSKIISNIDCDSIHAISVILWNLDSINFKEHSSLFEKITHLKNAQKTEQFL